jgi:sporulation protein YlmC with PRC-barrel domain
MEVVTESGTVIGRVGDVSFHRGTGAVEGILRDEGATARWLLGTESIPVSMIRGFRFGVGSQVSGYDREIAADDVPAEDLDASGAIVVDDDVVYLDAKGGLAEKAGTASAKAAHRGKQVLSKAKEQGADVAVAARSAAKEKVSPKVEEMGEKAGEAVNKGAFAAGRQIGRARGMFSGLLDEYRKGLEDE